MPSPQNGATPELRQSMAQFKPFSSPRQRPSPQIDGIDTERGASVERAYNASADSVSCVMSTSALSPGKNKSSSTSTRTVCGVAQLVASNVSSDGDTCT